jgi:hypothetical protein
MRRSARQLTVAPLDFAGLLLRLGLRLGNAGRGLSSDVEAA